VFAVVPVVDNLYVYKPFMVCLSFLMYLVSEGSEITMPNLNLAFLCHLILGIANRKVKA